VVAEGLEPTTRSFTLEFDFGQQTVSSDSALTDASRSKDWNFGVKTWPKNFRITWGLELPPRTLPMNAYASNPAPP
jgi:hypothetical protein